MLGRCCNSVKTGLNCPEEGAPQTKVSQRSEANVDIAVDLMNAIVRLRARENKIAPQTLAPHAELMKLARGHDEECELLKGWRYHVVGKELSDFLEGKFLLQLVDGNLKIIKEA